VSRLHLHDPFCRQSERSRESNGGRDVESDRAGEERRDGRAVDADGVREVLDRDSDGFEERREDDRTRMRRDAAPFPNDGRDCDDEDPPLATIGRVEERV